MELCELMPRRRRKSLLRSLPLWACALALVGWGLWQAREFRASLLTELQQTNRAADSSAEPPPESYANAAPDAATAPASADSSAGDQPDNTPNLVTVGAALGLDEPLAPYPKLPEKPQFDESLTADQLAAMGRGIVGSVGDHRRWPFAECRPGPLQRHCPFSAAARNADGFERQRIPRLGCPAG